MLLLVELQLPLHGNNELELSSRHRFQLAFKPFGVPSKCLDNLGVFDAAEGFDGIPVVHHTRNGSVQSLNSKRGPDPGAKGELRRGALEVDAVEGKIVCLEDLFIPQRGGPIIHRGFFCKDFRVLDEIVPLDGV